MTAKNKRLIAILISIALLLLIPLIAMQFTTEVNWTFMDFIAAAILLLAAGLSIEYGLRKIKAKSYRIVLVLIILLALLLIWAELADGLF